MIENRYFHSSENVKDYVRSKCGQIVLDVGAGNNPFSKAVWFIDRIKRESYNQLDICVDKFPFDDKCFDSVYCSHTLEDCYSPVFACQEMIRVGKSGYIETPSVAQEFCRGIEGTGVKYRGHHHHRYFSWFEGDTLYFLPKYPIIEYIDMPEEKALCDMLNSDPFLWTNCFFWEDGFEVKLLHHNIDFNIRENYGDVIMAALKKSIENSTELRKTVAEFELRKAA